MIVKLWRSITSIGITGNLSPREVRRVSFSNGFVLIALFCAVVRGSMSLSNLMYSGLIFSMVVPYGLVLILNYYHFYNTAKLLLIVISGLIVSGFSYFFLAGYHGGNFVILFGILLWPFMLFEIRQKAYILGCLIFILTLFSFLIVLQYYYPLPSISHINLIHARIAATILTIVVILYCTWFFYSSNQSAERRLLNEKIKADSANRAKSIFLANMSHELRTPMNAVLGLSFLTMQTQLTPKQRDYQNKIHDSANILLKLINDILDFSKIEAGKLELDARPFYLGELISSISHLVKLKAKEKGLIFSVQIDDSIPELLVGDSLRLSQILMNLMSNGIKFTEKGEIRLLVNLVEMHPEEVLVRFEIRDTGIGMTEEQLNTLFQPFQQADSSITRKYGGTGLGLAISMQLVEMLGGKLMVESVFKEGSKFFFTLTFGRSATAAPAATQKISIRKIADLLRDTRILVVEDNEINMQVACELLEQANIRVSKATDGKQAVERILKQRFDAVLMDIQMPGMDGITATRLIRQNPEFKELPILAMTANAMVDDREKSLTAGLNDHIPKPIKPAILYETLIRWLKPDVQLNRFEITYPDSVTQPSVETSDVFPALDGIDINIGLENVGGRPQLLHKTIRNMYKQFKNIPHEVQAELDREDNNAARRMVHTLIGVSGTIGAVALQHQAQKLESAIKDNQIDRIIELMPSFSKELNRVMTAIDQLPEAEEMDSAPLLEEPVKNAPDAEKLKVLANNLSVQISQGSYASLLLFQQFKTALEQSGIDLDVSKIGSALDEYDFESAIKILREIRRRLGE